MTKSPNGSKKPTASLRARWSANLKPWLAARCRGVGAHTGASVVFHTVNTIGVSRQRPYVGVALQRLGQPHAELPCPATPSFGAAWLAGSNGDRGFTPAQDDAGRLERRFALGGAACQGGVHLAHLATFALDLIAQDVGVQPDCPCGLGCRFQALLGSGNQVHRVRLAMVLQAGIAGFGRFQRAVLKHFGHWRRHINLVTLQNLKCVRTGGGVGHGGAAGDHAHVVARHVADGECDHACGVARGGQPASLDGRQVFAHAVHLRDVGSTFQQLAVDVLLVGQRQAVGGQGQQR
jgi:hypothetical protein